MIFRYQSPSYFRLRLFSIFILLLTVFAHQGQAQVSLVKDIYPGTYDSSPKDFVELNGKMYFIADYHLWASDGTATGTSKISSIDNISKLIISGNQLYFEKSGSLWVSDGTKEGSKEVYKNIRVGISDNYVSFNNKLFFATGNLTSGSELWVSDGTPTGTKMLKDINPGAASGYPHSFHVINNKVIFTASDATHGKEWWESDGTEAGTKMIKDINTEVLDINTQKTDGVANVIGELNGQVVFIGTNKANGNELWITDGTEAGTKLVKDIKVGEETGVFSSISTRIIGNGKLYFEANTNSTGRELWVSDGTTAGTKLVKDIYAGTSSSHVLISAVIDGKLYFSAHSNSTGQEPWVSDGTEAGTYQLKNINPGTEGSNAATFFKANNKIFFSAIDATHGRELWTTDGTEAGTKLVKDINIGSATGVSLAYNTFFFDEFNSKLLFVANDATSGTELWTSDGTEANTKILKDFYPGSNSGITTGLRLSTSIKFNGKLYFQAKDIDHGEELWVTDGTEAGTSLVKDLSDAASPSNIGHMTIMGNKLYFGAEDGIHGKELWVSDGTETGTRLIKDTYDGKGTYSDFNSVALNGKLYFFVGDQLWVSDGTEAGTKLVKDIVPTTQYDYPRNFFRAGNLLYFTVNDGVHGIEVWTSDGTEAGTKLLKDIMPGTNGSTDLYGYLNHVIMPNNHVLFVAENTTYGKELWITDGTEAGTKMIKDINTGTGSSVHTEPFVLMGNKVFFAANNNINGKELWVTDGTEAGTRMIKDINTNGDSSPLNLAQFNGKIYFSAENEKGKKLWVTDGTEAGTNLAFSENSTIYSPFNLSVFNNHLYFFTNKSLWRCDGTEESIRLIKTFNKANWYRIGKPQQVGDRLYINIDNNDTGAELWETNGTTIGTRMVDDINPGTGGSYPYFLTMFNNKLYFIASSTQAGRELHVYIPRSFPVVTQPVITDFNPKIGLTGTTVTITGEKFSADTAHNIVKFNGVIAKVITSTANELKVTVPEGATTGKITVAIEDSVATSVDDFVMSALTNLSAQLTKSKLITYPNPIKEVLHLRFQDATSNKFRVTIYNLEGQLILQDVLLAKNGEASITTAMLKPGGYLVRVQIGQDVIVKNMIKR